MGSGTLQNIMEREGPLALPKVAAYLDQLAAALDYAHERGIVHQDLKPTNVLMTSEGRLLLTDFGLGKMVAERQATQMRLLQSGMSIGCLEYIAPEQVKGDVLDARTAERPALEEVPPPEHRLRRPDFHHLLHELQKLLLRRR